MPAAADPENETTPPMSSAATTRPQTRPVNDPAEPLEMSSCRSRLPMNSSATMPRLEMAKRPTAARKDPRAAAYTTSTAPTTTRARPLRRLRSGLLTRIAPDYRSRR